MAFLNVLEQFIGRTGSGDSTALREYTRVFKIQVDSLLYDSRTILGAPGLPLLWDLYVGSDGVADEYGALLHKYSAEHTDDFLWTVTAHYTNQPKANKGRGKDGTKEAGDPNPLNRPTEVNIDALTFQQPIDFTPDGAPICSSSGERFDPAVTRDDSRRVYTFTRVVPVLSPLADDYKDVVNSDTWNGNPPGTAKIGTIKYVRADENSQIYWKETTPISVDLNGWAAKVMDVGTHWVNFAHQPSPFVGMHGEQLTGVHGLNGEGGPLYPTGDGQPGACSTLATLLPAAGTSVVVTSPAPGFPFRASTYPIVLKIDDELMQATAFDGTATFTVIRGYGGSLAAAHAANAIVQMQPYYRTFNRYLQLPFAVLNLP